MFNVSGYFFAVFAFKGLKTRLLIANGVEQLSLGKMIPFPNLSSFKKISHKFFFPSGENLVEKGDDDSKVKSPLALNSKESGKCKKIQGHQILYKVRRT